MFKRIRYIYSGILAVIKYEGIGSLISRGFLFILHRLCYIDNYYVTNRNMSTFQEEDEKQFLPKADNYGVRIISTNKEADELLAEGYNFGAYELNLRSSLDKGVTSICIFVDREFANIHSIADTQKAKDTIDLRPFPVNFKKGEAVGSRALTVPKFRRLGLRAYSGYLLRKYCQQKGYTRIAGTLGAKNYPALANSAKNPGTKIVAKYRFIKILWFRHLKEIKMNPITVKELLAQKSDHLKVT
jgi:hypothetical protein